MGRLLASVCSSLDQRFRDADEESAFVQSGEESRLTFLSWGTLAICGALLTYDGGYVYREMRQDVEPLEWAALDLRWITPCLTLACAAVCLAARAIGHLHRRRGYFARLRVEHLVIAVSVALVIRLSIGRKFNLIFFARDLDVAWVQRVDVADTTALLGLDAAVTALALSTALRVHLLVLVVGTSFVLWILATAVCGAPDNGWVHAVVLFMLMAFACSGAMRAESFIRREWKQQMRLAEQEQQICLQAALANSLQQVAERLCDLVVHLGPDLCVHSNAVPVNSFFGRNMFGRTILDVVQAADRSNLLEAFDRASDAQVPECVPVTLAEGACQGKVAQLLIASTGTAIPKFLVGVSVDAMEPSYEAGGSPLLRDVAEALEEAPGEASNSASECQTTFSGQAFLSMNLEQIVALGRAERWCIDAEDLRVPVPHCVVGEGGFGIVATACYLGQTVAVKVARGGGARLRAALMELRVLRRFRHPNVVLLHGAVVDPTRLDIALVYELLSGVLLHQLVETKVTLTAFDRFQILYATNSALTCLHLHSPSIVHGDLKPANIMVEETLSGFRPKLLDFGLSKFQGRSAGISGGTLAWQAPEVWLPHASAGSAADVFSFGWLALLIVAGAYPHDGADARSLRGIVQSMIARQESPAVVVPEAAPFRAQCQALCAACLQFDAARRPSMPDIQVALAGWVAEDAFCQLGTAAATRALRQVSWPAGAEALFEAEEAGAQPEAKVHFEADGFRVTRAECDAALVGALPLPGVGDSFCEWLEDPMGFRIFVLATLSDLRSGAKVAPLHQRLSLVRWRPRCPEGQPRHISIRILFPSTSGLVKMRLRFAALPLASREDQRTLRL